MPMAVTMGALILSQAIGPLLAAGLLSMDGVGGLEGWQWLFLIEGLLAVLCGFGWCAAGRSARSYRCCEGFRCRRRCRRPARVPWFLVVSRTHWADRTNPPCLHPACPCPPPPTRPPPPGFSCPPTSPP